MSDESKEGHLCVLCNNRLESKEALKEHFRKHANKEIDGKGRPVGPNGESPFDITKARGRGYEKGSASKFVDGFIHCDVCGEKFKCNTTAIQHKFRKHPQSVSKFYCPQCGMQFPLKIHRDKHLANHSPTVVKRNLKCSGCSETFYNKPALDYHYRSMHQRLITIYQPVMTPPPSKKIKVNNAGDTQSVYYCHLCGFEYIVKFNLQKHLETQHTKQERDNAPVDLIKCTTCEALFYNQKAYRNHNMYHRPDDLYVLTEEQRLATVTRVDQDFDIRRCVFGPEKYLPSPYQRRKRTSVVPPKIGLKKDESSDEMSPPSAMDTSSESESDIPLNKLMKKEQAKKAQSEADNKEKISEEAVKSSKTAEKPKTVGKIFRSRNKTTGPELEDSAKDNKPKTENDKTSTVKKRKPTLKKANQNNVLNSKETIVNSNQNNLKSQTSTPEDNNTDVAGDKNKTNNDTLNSKLSADVKTAPEVIEIKDDSDTDVPIVVPENEDNCKTVLCNQSENKPATQSAQGKNGQKRSVQRKSPRRRVKTKTNNLDTGVIEIDDSS